MLIMPRHTTREAWKHCYRLYRIALRESLKAYTDVLVFGSGAVGFYSDGLPKHIPITDILTERESEFIGGDV
jgi:hypothetical protein